MKNIDQPFNKTKVCLEDGEFCIDITCDTINGGFCNVGVGKGLTRKLAYKIAAKRLKELAEHCEIMSI